MRLTVHIKPNKKEEKVERISDSEFVAWTKKPAKEGKANEDVIQQLARYFKVPKTNIHIVRGLKSKRKIIEVSC